MTILLARLASWASTAMAAAGAVGIIRERLAPLRIFALASFLSLAAESVALIAIACLATASSSLASSLCEALTSNSDLAGSFDLFGWSVETCEERWQSLTMGLLAFIAAIALVRAWAAFRVLAYYTTLSKRLRRHDDGRTSAAAERPRGRRVATSRAIPHGLLALATDPGRHFFAGVADSGRAELERASAHLYDYYLASLWLCTPEDLALAHAIRVTVFVEEQKFTLEDEFDEKDPGSDHFVLLKNGSPIGTIRYYPPMGKLGRLAVLKEGRGVGAGRLLCEALEEHVVNGRGKAGEAQGGLEEVTIVANSQAYAQDGEPHIRMVKTVKLLK
ncbi:hypothetical protein RQP46_005389 [Phenoliferia psychrophenolica]